MPDIAIHRLYNQQLLNPQMQNPEEVVGWLGAVQAQDYAAAKWAVAQRTRAATDADLEQAFAEGTILRTHIQRPTWHFVLPADIRWMLALTAPRVKAQIATYDRRYELDERTLSLSRVVLSQALEGGQQLTRTELASFLEAAGIPSPGLRFEYLLMHAELDGILCSGARRGKQFTYALLDERAPKASSLERDEALAKLVWRYFTSHGPASLQDFAWWSGLTMADARTGLESITPKLVKEEIEGKTYWFAGPGPPAAGQPLTACLLPNYDEYIVGYTDRSAVYDGQHMDKLDSRGNVLFNHTMAVNGRIAGTWKRTIRKNAVSLSLAPFIPLTGAENLAFSAALERYSGFLGIPVEVN